MWGDFITYDGIYNFKNLSVIDKKFNLKQGGTIVWEGDPLQDKWIWKLFTKYLLVQIQPFYWTIKLHREIQPKL